MEHTQPQSPAASRTYNDPIKPPQQTRKVPISSAVLAVLCLLLLIGGFAAGMQYQKGKTTTTTANMSQTDRTNGSFNGMVRRAGGFGTVSAVSATSITIHEQAGRPGMDSSSGITTSKTYSISSSTTITQNGSTATVSDIAVGDTVFVRTSSSTSTAATAIQINPTMGGAPAMTQSDSSSATTPDTSTI